MKTTLAIIIAVTITPLAALAQSDGASEYMNSCASCHGADGRGNGPMAGYLNASLPDLTQLATNNGGVFPVTRVYETIEGSTEAGPHGTRNMPIWGNRYKSRSAETANPEFRDTEAEVYARYRILALTEFLAGIQE